MTPPLQILGEASRGPQIRTRRRKWTQKGQTCTSTYEGCARRRRKEQDGGNGLTHRVLGVALITGERRGWSLCLRPVKIRASATPVANNIGIAMESKSLLSRPKICKKETNERKKKRPRQDDSRVSGEVLNPITMFLMTLFSSKGYVQDSGARKHSGADPRGLGTLSRQSTERPFGSLKQSNRYTLIQCST